MSTTPWGIELFKENKIEQAIAKYTAAIRANPKNASAYRNRAIAYHAGADADIAMAKNQDEKIWDKMRKARLER